MTTSHKFIKIRTYTWPKDCHNLFDYESRHVLASEMKISNTSQVVLNNNITQILEENSSTMTQDPTIKPLFIVHKDSKGRFTLSAPGSELHPGLDVIVRGLKEDNTQVGYELKVGDYVKFGRVRFLVKEMRDHLGRVKRAGISQTNEKINYAVPEEEFAAGENNTGAACCRICLMDKIDEDPVNNTMLSPCKCKGSCGYVHYSCLRQWIDMKNNNSESNHSGGLKNLYKKLFCEICKDTLPFTLEIRGQHIDMLGTEKPANSPYILLERVDCSLDKKGLFVVGDLMGETWIGRSYSNKIVVNDISVSRSHASIKYENGKFLIFDNKSKFGTLVQVKEPIEITQEKMVIQCGKTVVAFSLKSEKIKRERSIEVEAEGDYMIPATDFEEKYGESLENTSQSDLVDEDSSDGAQNKTKLVSLSKKISKRAKPQSR
jgi:hypothetical protein